MLQNMLKQEVMLYVMSLFLVLGSLMKIISATATRRLVKAASEIQKSDHRLMKLVKAKFEHASMISDRVQNVEAFVDKFLYERRICGIKASAWRRGPKVCLFVVGGIGIFSAFESYRMEGFGELTLSYIQWTGMQVLFLTLLALILEEKTKITAARTYMVDYLENICISRYMKKHQAEKEKEMQATEKEELSENIEAQEEITETKTEEERKKEQQMRIRAILEEFLA